MNRIKVNSESAPIRCEICHQVDCFDPQTNKCSRCASIDEETPTIKTQSLSFGNIGLICGVFLAYPEKSLRFIYEVILL